MKNAIITISVLLIGLAFVGCEDNTTEYVIVDEGQTPTAPTGVYSITADNAVYLYWIRVEHDNLRYYRIWRNTDGGNQYSLYDAVDADEDWYEWEYVDTEVDNGSEYYYAVTAMDWDGNESGLSLELVRDVPRPEGFDFEMNDTLTQASNSGFDFSSEMVVPWNNSGSDIYIVYDGSTGTFRIIAADAQTFIQDMGYTESIDDINYAPLTGWSSLGWSEVIRNHTYVVKTRTSNYAKFLVTNINYGTKIITFDWAHQIVSNEPQFAPPNRDDAEVKNIKLIK